MSGGSETLRHAPTLFQKDVFKIKKWESQKSFKFQPGKRNYQLWLRICKK